MLCRFISETGYTVYWCDSKMKTLLLMAITLVAITHCLARPSTQNSQETTDPSNIGSHMAPLNMILNNQNTAGQIGPLNMDTAYPTSLAQWNPST